MLRAAEHDVSGYPSEKKNEAGRENEEKIKKKARKHEGQRQNEKDDEKKKRKALKRERKRSRSKEVWEERDLKTRRKLKAEPASSESISDTDL